MLPHRAEVSCHGCKFNPGTLVLRSASSHYSKRKWATRGAVFNLGNLLVLWSTSSRCHTRWKQAARDAAFNQGTLALQYIIIPLLQAEVSNQGCCIQSRDPYIMKHTIPPLSSGSDLPRMWVESRDLLHYQALHYTDTPGGRELPTCEFNPTCTLTE